MKCTLALAVLCFWSCDAAAQGPLRLTLDDAIARGLANSHRLAELQARTEGAKAAEAGSAAASMPSISFLGGYTRTNHVQEFRIVQLGQLVTIYPDAPDNYRTRVDLNWPVYSAGRTDALELAAEAERKATEEDIGAARADLRLEVTRAFWALVSAIEAEHVLARALDTIGAHVGDLRSRFDQGLIAPNEVLIAEAQQSRQRVLAIEATNLRGVSEADLRRLIGLDTADRIEPVAVLDSAPGPVGGAEGLVGEAGRSEQNVARSRTGSRRPARARTPWWPRDGRRSASPAAMTTCARTRTFFRGQRSGRTRGMRRSTSAGCCGTAAGGARSRRKPWPRRTRRSRGSPSSIAR